MGRALVAGWFSFDEVVATVGDLMGRDVTLRWLQEAGWDCDAAVAPYMGEGVDWRQVDPAEYDLLVFTTGPLSDTGLMHALLDRFAGRRRWAVNVSLVAPGMRDRFDRVWERDGAGPARPDQAFTAAADLRPVLAVAYAPEQAEYGAGRHGQVGDTVRRWLEQRRLAAVELDMDMYAAHRHPRTPGQVESLVARSDVVVSMRLHGTVLGLRHGRPVVVLDPIEGGGKLTSLARLLDWPCLLPSDRVSAAALDEALAWCRTPTARERAARCRDAAVAGAERVHREVTDAARAVLPESAAVRDRV